MKHELRRIDPLRAANVAALVYGLIMGAFALIALPFFLVAAFVGEFGAAGLSVFFVVLYPVMGLVMGWISGLLASAIYNFIVRWTGGLLLEFDGGTASPGGGAA